MSATTTTVDGSDDKFRRAPNLYASSRPSYPPALVTTFVSSIPGASRKRSLDVAAGSGQLSVLLAKHFEHVVALDKSRAQLQHAIPIKNVNYVAGVATQLPHATIIEGNDDTQAFDAVTCAQAYHWFIAEGIDRAFLMDVRRVLHPDHGRLGIFGYGVCSIVSSPALEKAFKEFYFDDLGSQLPPSSPDCYWENDRRLLDSNLADIPTYGVMEVVERQQHTERHTMSVHQFLNYIRTFSALENLRKKYATEKKIDPMERLCHYFGENSKDGELMEVEYPFFLIILKPCPTTTSDTR